MSGQGQTDGSVNAPVAAGQGDTAQPAPAQDVQVQPIPGQGDTSQPAPVNPVPDSKGPIPYDRFEEVNKAKKAAEEQLAQMQTQMMQMQSVLTQVAAQRNVTPTAPQTPLSRYTPNDLLDPAKAMEAMQVMYDDLQKKMEAAIGQVQFQSQYGDFDRMVGTVHPVTGQWVPSDLMAEAIKEDPQLPAQIQQSGNPKVFAYRVAKMQQQIRDLRAKAQTNPTPPTPQIPPVQVVAQQIKAAQQAPVSISAATGTGQLDRTNAVQNMPEAEFQQRLARAKTGGSFW